MSIAEVLLVNFAIIIGCVIALWIWCLTLRDVTVMDTYWALGFVVVAWASAAQTGGAVSTHQLALTVLVSVWALRLASFLYLRWRDHGPDSRYVHLLEKAEQKRGWGFARASLLLVFLTQAPMQWLVSLPVQLGQIGEAPAHFGLVAQAGVLIACLGIAFESIGDGQLAAFRADPANQGKVMDRGLWRYTRHPNYFGDACVWWGLFLIAAETPFGVYALPGPLLLNWTLVKWSGAATLERRMKRSRPDYDAYIARTSGFLPWPPKRVP